MKRIKDYTSEDLSKRTKQISKLKTLRSYIQQVSDSTDVLFKFGIAPNSNRLLVEKWLKMLEPATTNGNAICLMTKEEMVEANILYIRYVRFFKTLQ